MANVVEIGDFRLKHQRRRIMDAGCQHKHLTLDDDGDFVTCDDCQNQVGTYFALRMLVQQWVALQERVDAQRRSIAEAAEKTVELRAAQVVEKAWRRRSMVPACPHCNAAILPEDGFGSSLVNRAIELRRRAVKKDGS